MIAGVAVLLAAQSALVLDAAADQISIEQRSRVVTSSGGRDLSSQPASSTAANASKK
jgi:hypothetical protein